MTSSPVIRQRATRFTQKKKKSLEKLDTPCGEAGPGARSESRFERSRHRLVDFATRAQYHSNSLRYSHRGSSIKLGCLVALRLRATVVSPAVPYPSGSSQQLSRIQSFTGLFRESAPRDYLTSDRPCDPSVT